MHKYNDKKIALVELCALSLLLLLQGCTQQLSVSFFDDFHELNTVLTDSFALSRATMVSVNGTKYKTPYYYREQIQKTLQPIAIENRLKLPYEATEKEIVGWSAATLATGDVLICGGSIANDPKSVLDRSWLFSSKSQKIVAGPRLKTSCSCPNLLLLKNGQVLVTGGFSGENVPLNQTQIFDLTTNSFIKSGSMAVPRARHAVMQLDDRKVIIVSGETTKKLGEGNGLQPITAAVEILDLVANCSVLVDGLSIARTDPILVRYKKNVLVIGGFFVTDMSKDFRWLRDWEVLSVPTLNRSD